MDKWLMFGGYILYIVCAAGMLEFLHHIRISSRALRILGALFWPLTLISIGIGTLLEAIISALVDAL